MGKRGNWLNSAFFLLSSLALLKSQHVIAFHFSFSFFVFSFSKVEEFEF